MSIHGTPGGAVVGSLPRLRHRPRMESTMLVIEFMGSPRASGGRRRQQTTDPPRQVLPLVSRHRPRSVGTTHDGWSSWVPVTTRALTYRSWLVAGWRAG